jgi:DNA polymerase-3 subunit alpha
VENLVERLNKKTGRRTAVFMLEDLTGAVEVFVPPQALERAEAVLRSGQPVLCTGRTETASFREAGRGDESDDETTRFVLTEAATIESVRLDRTRAVHLRLDAPRVDAPVLERLARLVDANRGSCAVFLHVRVPHRGESVIALPDRFRVAPTDQFVLGVARDFGPGAVALA